MFLDKCSSPNWCRNLKFIVLAIFSDRDQHRPDVLRGAPRSGGAQRRHCRLPDGVPIIVARKRFVAVVVGVVLQPRRIHVLRQTFGGGGGGYRQRGVTFLVPLLARTNDVGLRTRRKKCAVGFLGFFFFSGGFNDERTLRDVNEITLWMSTWFVFKCQNKWPPMHLLSSLVRLALCRQPKTKRTNDTSIWRHPNNKGIVHILVTL